MHPNTCFDQQQNKRWAELNLKIFVLNRGFTCITCFFTKIQSHWQHWRGLNWFYFWLSCQSTDVQSRLPFLHLSSLLLIGGNVPKRPFLNRIYDKSQIKRPHTTMASCIYNYRINGIANQKPFKVRLVPLVRICIESLC